ncbi:MAG: TfoX/Sxy family protein [Rhodobacteraceae bacterium]|nr:TfoX/Sxy family protein [Paracoccaceae bacterium]
MAEPVSSIRNLGPASDVSFARAGIHSADELRAIGADAAYTRLLENGAKPHFIGYYVIVMGLQGRPWNDCQGSEKQALRQKFDVLKAKFGTKPREEAKFEQILDRIGIMPAKK